MGRIVSVINNHMDLYENCLIYSRQERASRRSASLNEAYGQQGFLADSKELVRSVSFLICTLCNCVNIN